MSGCAAPQPRHDGGRGAIAGAGEAIEAKEAKRLKRLTLNRKAAQNSRQRKTERIQGLEYAVVNLYRENYQLQNVNDSLRKLLTNDDAQRLLQEWIAAHEETPLPAAVARSAPPSETMPEEGWPEASGPSAPPVLQSALPIGPQAPLGSQAPLGQQDQRPREVQLEQQASRFDADVGMDDAGADAWFPGHAEQQAVHRLSPHAAPHSYHHPQRHQHAPGPPAKTGDTWEGMRMGMGMGMGMQLGMGMESMEGSQVSSTEGTLVTEGTSSDTASMAGEAFVKAGLFRLGSGKASMDYAGDYATYPGTDAGTDAGTVRGGGGECERRPAGSSNIVF